MLLQAEEMVYKVRPSMTLCAVGKVGQWGGGGGGEEGEFERYL